MSNTLAIIGSGNMGRSLIGGLINTGYSPKQIIATDPHQQHIDNLKQQFSIQATTNNHEAIVGANVVIFAIKPQIFKTVALDLKKSIQISRPLIISIAAGITTHHMENWLGKELSIIRAMPNTPALINSGATGLYANSSVNNSQKKLAETILSAVGITCWVESEDKLDVITALSGSGPAYFFLIMEALQQAATKFGLPPETAALLIQQTAYGAARMAIETKTPLNTLREQVTSPGGTTERGLATLEECHIRAILEKTIYAAKQRSEELAKLFD